MDAIKKILKELPATQYGAALKAFLEDELRRIDSVDGIKSFEEVRGRQIAKELIKEIFAFYPKEAFDTLSKRKYN